MEAHQEGGVRARVIEVAGGGAIVAWDRQAQGGAGDRQNKIARGGSGTGEEARPRCWAGCFWPP
jgi:hypothetical protein